MSPLSELIASLGIELSENGKIFSDPEDPKFEELLQRWSDIDLKVPGAIILVGTENDVSLIVSLLVLVVACVSTS